MQSSSEKHIVLTITEACNLSCVYCYEKNKAKKYMDFSTASQILEYELNLDDGFDRVSIEFFGGEPFLNFQLIVEIVAFLKKRSWKKTYSLFATTNGTLIHGSIKKWLKDHANDFCCGLSLDGTKEMHNINRSSSFDFIDIDFFKSMWPKQKVKMTVSDKTIESLADGVIFLHQLGFYVSVNLAYGIDWNLDRFRDTYADQMSKLVEFYSTNPDITPCSLLSRDISVLAANDRINSKWCGAGTSMKVYDVCGKLFPCQFFEEMTTKESYSNMVDFNNVESLIDSTCKHCLLLPVCPTCYGYNYATTGDPSKRDPNLCEMTKITLLASAKLQYKYIKQSSAFLSGHFSDDDSLKLIAIKKIQDCFKSGDYSV